MLFLPETGGAGHVALAQDLWAAAIVMALAGGVLGAGRTGLDRRDAFNAGVVAVVMGLVSGRLWLVLWSSESVSLAAAFDLLEGEKSVIGAMLGAGFGIWSTLAWRRRAVLPYVDAAVPAVCVAYAVGRLGCLFAGCCFGTPTDLPWAVAYAPGSAPYLAQQAAGLIAADAGRSLAVHPVAMYHVLLGLGLAWVTRRCNGVPGRTTAVGLAGYGIGRFALEFLRGDALPAGLGLSAAQWACLGFIALAGLLQQAGQARRLAHRLQRAG